MSTNGARAQLGGMALANGLLVHSNRHWAAAVTDPRGRVVVASGPKPRFARGPLARVPVLRGVLRMAEAFAVLPAMRRRLPEARFAIEDLPAGAGLVVSALVAGSVRSRVRVPVVQDLAAAILSLAPTLVALRTSRASIWHGVEHKSIAAYEAGGPAGVDRAADHAKEHPRCGSNLVVPLLITSTLANAIGHALVRGPSPLTRAALGLASIGTAVEIFAFAGRNPRHPVARVVHGVGGFVQSSFATREPNAGELRVGRRAIDALLLAEGATSPR